MSEPKSKVCTVRIPPQVRQDIDRLSALSDRTVAQLVRYAVEDYLHADMVPSAEAEGEVDMPTHLVFRLPQSFVDAVENVAREHGTTPSVVIRAALTRWLTTADEHTLGMPQRTTGVPRGA